MATVREIRGNGGTRRVLMITTVIVPVIALASGVIGVAVTRANDTRDIRENTNGIERAHIEIGTLKQTDKEIARVIVDIRLQMAKVDVQMIAVQKELELSRKLRENGH